MKFIVATAPGESAQPIASALLEARLVACVNVIPGVKSRYWWKGELEQADEVMLFMKTTDELAEKAVAKLVEVHPYDVPEALVFDVEGGHRPYFDWVGEVTL